MAIVCACLTTLRPLFVGVNLSFLSSLSWKRSNSTSSSSAKSKRPWSSLKNDGESDQKKEDKLMSSLYERHKSDMEILGFEMENKTGKQESKVVAESVEGEEEIREVGSFVPMRAKSGDSMV